MFTLAFLAAAAGPAQPPAAPDPETASPGLWRVVVVTTPHPLLTPAFRDRLRRDLLAALPAAAHPVAAVEVVDLADVPRDKWEPLWQQVEAKGFAALDAPRDLTGVTTSVLTVAVRDAAYQLEARLYDGFAGLAAPPVRRQTVRAPELVGRAAGLLVGRDFGPVGTVEAVEGSPDAARIRFRAGAAGPLDRLVKVGDVFAVSRVTQTARTAPPQRRTSTGKLIELPPGSVPPPVLSAAPRDYTYLRVTKPAADGVAECTVVSKWKDPLKKDATYRCLKLATVRSPVAVRLVNPAVDAGKDPPTRSATVRATDRGYFPGTPDRREFFDFADGVYKSAAPLDGIACVTIALGASREDRFPLAVFGPDPVGVPFAVDAKAEEKAAHEKAVVAVFGRASEARLAQNAGFDAIGALIKEKRNPDALARARSAFASAETAALALTDEVKGLRGRPGSSPEAEELLTGVEKQVEALRASNAQLGQRVKDLETVVQSENSPAADARALQAQALNVRIRALLEGGEVDEAITAYDQLLTLIPNQPEVKARRDRLADEWKTKSEDHAKAREYLIQTWPKAATAADLKDSLPKVRSAVDTLKAVKDVYALRRAARLVAAMPARIEELSRGASENAAELAALRETAGVLARLDQEIAEFLRKSP